MSNSLRTHGLQHVRLPCPPLFPRICVYSCLLSQRCYLTISFFAAPFSSCLQYSELISFRIDWFNLALHGALKSPPAPQFASITSLALTFLFHLIVDFEFYMNQTFFFLSFIFHQNMITFAVSLLSFSVCLIYP